MATMAKHLLPLSATFSCRLSDTTSLYSRCFLFNCGTRFEKVRSSCNECKVSPFCRSGDLSCCTLPCYPYHLTSWVLLRHFTLTDNSVQNKHEIATTKRTWPHSDFSCRNLSPYLSPCKDEIMADRKFSRITAYYITQKGYLLWGGKQNCQADLKDVSTALHTVAAESWEMLFSSLPVNDRARSPGHPATEPGISAPVCGVRCLCLPAPDCQHKVLFFFPLFDTIR